MNAVSSHHVSHCVCVYSRIKIFGSSLQTALRGRSERVKMKFLLGRVNELSIIHITGKSTSDKIRQPQVEEVLNLFHANLLENIIIALYRRTSRITMAL